MSSRERFEAWLVTDVLLLNPDDVMKMWTAWQAAERQALERAIAMLEADSGEATEWGFERYARYTAEVADKIRALMQDASSEKEGS